MVSRLQSMQLNVFLEFPLVYSRKVSQSLHRNSTLGNVFGRVTAEIGIALFAYMLQCHESRHCDILVCLLQISLFRLFCFKISTFTKCVPDIGMPFYDNNKDN